MGDYPFSVKSAQDYLHPEKTLADLVRLRQVSSARQAAEWGMRGLPENSPRRKDRMVYEERGGKRRILISVVKLFTLQAGLVGSNEILSWYMPHLGSGTNQLLFFER